MRYWLRRIFRVRNGAETLRDTIEELIEKEEIAEDASGDELVFLRNILKLRDLAANDVMVPRADIVAVEIDTSLPDLVLLMSGNAHSRVPVYRETLDDAVGMVHIKDVLACWDTSAPFELSNIVRRVLFVAPSMPMLELLLQMRANRTHMALVVDEFGGIDGLITIEDLVEEIVGEIEDEHDAEVAPEMAERADGSIEADARVQIEDFEERVGVFLTAEERDDDIETLGGLVFFIAGRVPGRGEVVRHESGIEFEILDADPRRIKRVKVGRLPTSGH
jgi:CBS domain containing-hemolysin-like protein